MLAAVEAVVEQMPKADQADQVVEAVLAEPQEQMAPALQRTSKAEVVEAEEMVERVVFI